MNFHDPPRALTEFYSNPEKEGTDGKVRHLEATSLRLSEAMAVFQLIRESHAKDTLEIGMALGASSIAIAEALKSNGDGKHTVLDPFQADFGNIGLMEIERLGLGEYISFLPELSEDFLYRCSKEGRTFDLILNDGAHSIGDKVTNTFYADKCLSDGGIMIFHDCLIPSTAASMQYLVRERNYEVIRLPADSKIKRLVRVIRHSPSCGFWYSKNIVTSSCRSLVAARKTKSSSR